MTRFCLDCDAPVRKGKSGCCISCAAKRRWADPMKRAAHSEPASRGAAKRRSDPQQLAALRSSMLANRAEPTAEVIAKANASRDRTVMGWCPTEYRALNATLRRRGLRLPARKQAIATEMLAEAERREEAKRARLAAMSPFERQLERVRNGAKLVERFTPRAADPTFTLGGVATGML